MSSGPFPLLAERSETEVEAGDCWFVPPGAPHGAVALEAGAVIDVFAPARAEFLEGRE